MSYAAAIFVCRKYLHERLPVPVNVRSKRRFKDCSYSRWAAEEIMGRIMAEELQLPYHISGLEQRIPVEVAKEFIEELHYMWETTENPERKHMFSVAMYTAEDILSLLYY